MLALFLLKLLVLTVANSASSTEKSANFSVVFEWNYLNFTAPPTGYAPGQDVIAGIKIYKNTIYLALPRLKPSARITLASIPLHTKHRTNPLLAPFPNWEMNSGPNCATLQNILSMEIDIDGIMWVLDARRVDNTTKCPPKIVLFDLNSNGKLVQSFIVPNELCPHNNGCFLNDIVVDGDFAYMSDTTASDPGIFVYNRRLNSAWKARDNATMSGSTDPSAIRFTAQGVENTSPSHINGIALSCKKIFYYMPQTSFHIYGISTRVLQNKEAASGNISAFIVDEGRKAAQSGGMICDTKGDVYYGLLPLDAVGMWASQSGDDLSKSGIIVEQNSKIIRWPDSFAIYEGELYLITNSISRFGKYGVQDFNEINFRIIKLHTGTSSYIYC